MIVLEKLKKSYLKRIVVSTRNTYIKQNKENMDFNIIPIEETEGILIDPNDTVRRIKDNAKNKLKEEE